MALAVFYVFLSLYRLNIKQKWYVDVVLAIVLWGDVYLVEIYGANSGLLLLA